MTAVINGPYGKHVLREGYSILGRGDECDICLNDPRLSRSHARFFWCKGMLQIEDMNSHNGILVNGEVVHGLSNLFDGNLITIVLIDETPDKAPCMSVADIHNNSNGNDIVPVERPKTLPDNNQTVAEHSSNDSRKTRRSKTEMEGAKQTTEIQDHTQEIPASDQTPQTLSGRRALTSRRENKAPSEPYNLGAASTISDNYYAPAEANNENISPVRPQHDESTVIHEIQPHAAADVHTQSQERERMNQLLPKESVASGFKIKKSGTVFVLMRICACIFDCVQIIILCVLLSFPILCGGYYMALSKNHAAIVQSLPTFDVQSEHLAWQEVALSFSTTDGWQRAWKLVGEVYKLFPQSFIWIFCAIAASLAAIALCLLFTLIAATTIKGAPFWHRKFQIVIVEKQNGFYPTPLRSCARWTLAILFTPLALLTCIMNIRGLHDHLSGCEIKPRRE
ncbi:MAG: FHA domain-containing protein [Planctomycetes bacterium]|nr:FHA domain-containing protein [Planctomycetota bacterium]